MENSLPSHTNPVYSRDYDDHEYIDPSDWQPGSSTGPGIHEVNLNNNNPQHVEISTGMANTNIDDIPGQGSLMIGQHSSMNSAYRSFRNPGANLMCRQSVQAENEVYKSVTSNPDASTEEIKDKLRSVNQSLTLKRSVKARLNRESMKKKSHKNITCMKRLKYRLAMTWQHFQYNVREVSQSLNLWHSHLKQVQGHFGSSVASYFFFLRWLFYINFMTFLIFLAFVITPQLVIDQDISNDTMLDNNSSFQGLEFLMGNGVFESSVLYYGHYDSSGDRGYSMPKAYILASVAYILCCIIFLSYSLAKSYRVNYIEASGDIHNLFANKIFTAWDYCIEKLEASKRKSRSISNELLELIAYTTRDEINRTFSDKLLWLLRGLINLIILSFFGGAGYLIHYLLSQKIMTETDVLPFFKEMSLSFVVTTIAFIVPFIFSYLSRWEKYSNKETQLYLNMIRIVTFRLVILGVVTYFWLNPEENGSRKCWETKLGSEVYRLIIMDFFFVLIFSTFVMEFLRRLLFNFQIVQDPEFDIAQNTLDVIYTQMLTWIGFFYCPLISLITVIKITIIFYVKRISVVQNCLPSQKPFRASHAQTIFLALTFLNLLMAMVAVGYSILFIVPSGDCGPFQGMGTSYEVILNMFLLNQREKMFLSYLLSPGVIAGALIFLGVMLYYARASSEAHKEMVDLLREQLTMEGKDKVFLLKLFEEAMKKKKASLARRNQSSSQESADIQNRQFNEHQIPIAKDEHQSYFKGINNQRISEGEREREGSLEEIEFQPTKAGWRKSREEDNIGYNQRWSPETKVNLDWKEKRLSSEPHGGYEDNRQYIQRNPNNDWSMQGPSTKNPYSPFEQYGNERDESPTSNSSFHSRKVRPIENFHHREHSNSPSGSNDSQRRRGPKMPKPDPRPIHQHGFQQLSHDPDRNVRNHTPQRY